MGALYVALVVFVFYRLFNNPLKSKINNLGGSVDLKGHGTITVDGQTVMVKYVYPSRSSPAQFLVYAKGTFGGTLIIRKETAADRFFKRIGLNRELPILDQELGERFYFECDVPEFLNPLLTHPDSKSLLLDIFNYFSVVRITPTVCIFRKSPSDAVDKITETVINDKAAQLIKFIRLVPSATIDVHPEVFAFRRWSLFLRVLSGVLLAAGYILLIWATAAFKVVDESRIWSLSAIISVIVFLLVSGIAYWKLKGFSSSGQVLLIVILMLAPGIVLTTRFGAAVLNGLGDASAVQNFDQVIVNKYTTSSKGRISHHAVAAPWHAGMRSWTFFVPQDQYNTIQLGSTHYQILTKAGRLGFEWVIAAKPMARVLINKQISAYDREVLAAAKDDNQRGIYDYRHGDRAGAIDSFSKSIDLLPHTASNAYMNRAFVYYRLKEYDKAWADVRQAQSLGIRVNPVFIEALKKASG